MNMPTRIARLERVAQETAAGAVAKVCSSCGTVDLNIGTGAVREAFLLTEDDGPSIVHCTRCATTYSANFTRDSDLGIVLSGATRGELPI